MIRYTGAPSDTMATPSRAWSGLFSSMRTSRTPTIARKISAVHGWPGTVSDVSRRRTTNTAATVNAMNTTVMKMKYATIDSNVPSATRTHATNAWAAIALVGVPNRGCTAAAAAGNTPSRAMAKYARGASIITTARLPRMHASTTSVTAIAPDGPSSAVPTCDTKASPALTWSIGTTYMNASVISM